MEIIHSVESVTPNGVPELVEKGIIDNLVKYNCIISEGGSYDENDFELVLSKKSWDENTISIGDWIYIPESEWGGKVKCIQSTSDETIKISGPNFRSELSKIIIAPLLRVKELVGSVDIDGFDAYFVLNGEANFVINKILFKLPLIIQSTTGTYQPDTEASKLKNISVNQASSGIDISVSLRFQEFTNAIEKVLLSSNARLDIRHQYINDGYKLIQISAHPIIDYSDDMYLSTDYQSVVTSKIDESMKCDYLIALGKGELEERQIVVLRANYETKQLYEVFTGTESDIKDIVAQNFNHNAVIYDYPSVESIEELITAAKEKFESDYLPSTEINFQINNTSLEFNLGDIVAGEDVVTNAKVKARIIQKELTIEKGKTQFNYKVGDITI
ncbi:hypothetical protein AOC36_09515 [Erysipelothrix larvae]|uniref:Uncharacterized protein n=1 Tax=Erysipelothrix larvae TaxID=1514105 RepID=A0A0X8H190_9FIRM|nr:hypothetical protein [Erysipelothrix larvae]AMC94211.1 hypothetical protein AOC36_09515 [Erysipelothrix larvae]